MVDRKSHKYEIEKILTSPDKGVSKTRGIGGILARLWREMLNDVNMSPNRFEILLSDFIAASKRPSEDNRVTQHLARGNLRRELQKEIMTIKVFVNAMKFLKVKSFVLSLELTHSTGKKTTHKVEVDVEKVRAREAGSILATLRTTILHELDVSETRFEQLLSNYIINAKQATPSSRAPRHLTRAGWRRELEKEIMTFKTLVKVLKFLNVVRFKITIEAIQATGILTIHQTTVDLGMPLITTEIFNEEDPED